MHSDKHPSAQYARLNAAGIHLRMSQDFQFESAVRRTRRDLCMALLNHDGRRSSCLPTAVNFIALGRRHIRAEELGIELLNSLLD